MIFRLHYEKKKKKIKCIFFLCGYESLIRLFYGVENREKGPSFCFIFLFTLVHSLHLMLNQLDKYIVVYC